MILQGLDMIKDSQAVRKEEEATREGGKDGNSRDGTVGYGVFGSVRRDDWGGDRGRRCGADGRCWMDAIC